MGTEYPVLEVLSELRQQLSSQSIVILQAPPGAGKSTVLPLQLLTEPWLAGQKMIMLEPRRLAARSVAFRMASLIDQAVGETVGYRIRFENKTSSATRIEVVTEGILTRLLQNDNSLEGIGLIIFDEFHERSLQADLALALSLQAQKILRDDLRILIMSATLDGSALSAMLGSVPVVVATGRQFQVELRYHGDDSDAPIAVRTARVVKKALRENSGDVLAFLPGAGEIARTKSLLEAEGVGAEVLTLYGDLPMSKQQEAILPLPGGRRKIVLSTSIAETSLTIEGITVVVDSGYSRVPRFDPRSGLTRLETIRVTKDAADQRSGRAGRLQPGVGYRLWTEGINAGLVRHRVPEILEADLASLILELSQWGVNDPKELHWITPPPSGAVSQARELLEQLEALDHGRITDRGRKMLQLPTHPRIAHMLLLSVDGPRPALDGALAADIAALLEEKDPLPRDAGADLSLRVEILRQWRRGEIVNAEKNSLERVERLASSWRRIFKLRDDNSTVDDGDVGRLLAAAYPERIARQVEPKSDRFRLANGRVARLPPHDPLQREPWLSVAHLDAGSGEGKIFLAAPLDESDLQSLAQPQSVVRWNEDRGMVEGVIEKRIGSVVLESRPMAVILPDDKIKAICQAVRKEGLSLVGGGDLEWQSRVMSLRRWRPDDGWPDVADDHLLNTLEEWLPPYLVQAYRRTDLQRLDWNAMMAGLLPWNLAKRLDSLAPAKLEVPSGSMIALRYNQYGDPPVMEVRLQEVFGLLETPTVNEGKVKIIIHLLSPGYKPVQVTQDLKSFWQTAYHEVRKELRIRYRKHSWPEDPWTALAVRGTKKSR